MLKIMNIDGSRSRVIAKLGAAPAKRAIVSIPVDIVDPDALSRADVISGDYVRGQVRTLLFEAGLSMCMTRMDDPRKDRFYVDVMNNQELVARVVAKILGMKIIANGRKVVLEIDKFLLRQSV